jgi:hypothetical protein
MEKKLNRKEFVFCKKLHFNINKMDFNLEKDRIEIIKYIEKMCNKKEYKYDIKYKRTDQRNIFYDFILNEKHNYILFDKLGIFPTKIIPANTIILE